MATTPPTDDTARRMSLSHKLTLVSGAGVALACGAAPGSAHGEVIRSNTLPLSPPATDTSYFWDIDGDGTNDFSLRNSSTSTAELNDIGASRLVRRSPSTGIGADNFAKLLAGFTVGSVMPSGFSFVPTTADHGVTNDGTHLKADALQGGWTFGDVGYFGFKFSNTSGVHYGWGQLNIHGTTGGFAVGQGYTITEAWYNNTPGASIQVGDTGTAVPEIDPASAGSVMSLVMGSLAMLERRRKLRAADASPTTVSA